MYRYNIQVIQVHICRTGIILLIKVAVIRYIYRVSRSATGTKLENTETPLFGKYVIFRIESDLKSELVTVVNGMYRYIRPAPVQSTHVLTTFVVYRYKQRCTRIYKVVQVHLANVRVAY
jgi:hypothetical protein